ncbi:MAG: BON domain-containing protein [Acidobacteria bacterium]|nr:BON domain-containing protein [Acidobacteriota bacterium]
MKNVFFALFIVATLLVASGVSANSSFEPQKKKKKLEQRTQTERDSREVERLAKAVRKELVTIPTFGVFDWLEGNVEPDGTVHLRGEVTRPTIKKDAERRVRKLEGVASVDSRIEVLPLSPNDDRLRRAVYRELFNSGSPLFRYGQGAVPSIHIIIKNGRLTLKGVVSSKSDSDLAKLKAGTVSGLFEVQSELQVEK